MNTKFVALLNSRLAVTGLSSAGSQRPATDSDILMLCTIYIALTLSLPTLEILRIKGYLCEILLDTTLYLQLSMFVSLLGFFTIIVSCRDIIRRLKPLLHEDSVSELYSLTASRTELLVFICHLKDGSFQLRVPS